MGATGRILLDPRCGAWLGVRSIPSGRRALPSGEDRRGESPVEGWGRPCLLDEGGAMRWGRVTSETGGGGQGGGAGTTHVKPLEHARPHGGAVA